MKEGIHPKYEITTVKCACGNVFETRSTIQNIRLDICNACHPFFTGKQKLVDSAGRVDRFMKKTSQKSEEKKLKKVERATVAASSVKKPSAKKQKIKILSTSVPKVRPDLRKKKGKESKPA